MNRPIPSYLRIHTEDSAPEPTDALNADARRGEIRRVFEAATGWKLDFELSPTTDRRQPMWFATGAISASDARGSFVLGERAADVSDVLEQDAAESLAALLTTLDRELSDARTALCHREAEVAAAVPVSPRQDEAVHLADRLAATLKACAESVGCDAAGLYLLDDQTTSLKLRAEWQLPPNRLAEPARALDGSLADLEALLGHAVVMADTSLYPSWNIPEDYPAAVCVPVSSPSIPLGTLWLFSETARDFDDRETNIVELAAGRLAADLEREVLLTEGLDGARLKRQLATAERIQSEQSPNVAPMLSNWQLSGWAEQAELLGGAFYDWFVLPDGRLAVAAGDCDESGLPQAMTVSGLRATVRAHAQHLNRADQLLARVNETFWSGSAGDLRANLAFAIISPTSGAIDLAFAGAGSVWHITAKHAARRSGAHVPLGVDPDTEFGRAQFTLAPGEGLALIAEGTLAGISREGGDDRELALVQEFVDRGNATADEWTEIARDRLGSDAVLGGRDRAILVIRHTR